MQLIRVPEPSTPAFLRVAAAVIALGTLALSGLLAIEVHRERAGLSVIGDRSAPEVAAASDLYFALNDMDAQIANVLLVGNATDLGFTQAQALAIYEQRRQQVDRDVQRAGAADAGVATRESILAVLDDLGRYEAQAAQTILLAQQANSRPGLPSTAALNSYRSAEGLLVAQLLPEAHRLTDANSQALEASYHSQHGRILTSRAWFVAGGLILLTLLLGLQVSHARRFRRVLAPFLVLATALVATQVVLGTGLLSHEAEDLRVAKKDAFDSIVALSRARAVSYDANADESRYLVDPARAQQYQLAFFDKTQQVALLPGATISTWDQKLGSAVRAYDRNNTQVGWAGYLGTEFRNITFTSERTAAQTTLTLYRTYQVDDRRIRALATAGHLDQAIAFCTSYAPGQSNYAFTQYDLALSSLIAINQKAFTSSVRSGRQELNHWTPGLGIVCIAVIALLGAATRPRLREYR